MAVGSVNLAQDFNLQGANLNATNQAVQQGSFQGMSVAVADDPLSALANSAEELTFAKDNSKQTKLSDRKQKLSESRIKEQLERIKEALKSTVNSDNTAHQNALKTWQSKSKDPKDLLNMLKELGSHPSSSYAFLAQEEEKSTGELKELLKDAQDLLFKENKAEILAVANTIGAFSNQEVAPSLVLSETYADISTKPHNPTELLEHLSKKFGQDNLEAGIDAMFKALACDLNSTIPSQEEGILKDVASTLAKTKTLNGSLKLTNNFLDRVQNSLGLKVGDLSGSKILLDLVNLSHSRFIAPLHVQNLYKGVVTSNPEEDVLVAQEFLRMGRELSEDLFDSLEDRNKLLDSTQRLVDELVDKEDEWLEMGGE